MLSDQDATSEPAVPYVLLVEDEAVIRALLAEELRSYGLTVVEAANADEAWAYLQTGGAAHLIFSDVTMPGSMNGVDLIRRVKSAYPTTKAILTSGNPGAANMAELGLFLPKPYRLSEAAATALRCLGLQAGP
jgi:CheY-like chemotaxis protein